MRVRREKLDRMRERGVDPYPVRFPRTTTLADLRAAHPELEPDTATGEQVGVAGRVVLSAPAASSASRRCATAPASCR